MTDDDFDRLCKQIRDSAKALNAKLTTQRLTQMPRDTLVRLAQDLQTTRLRLERVLREGRVQ